MSVQTELDKLIENINGIYNNVEEKGGTIPTNKNLTNLSIAVQSIPDSLDTSDATAVSTDILKDKTAYVDGEKITGTLEIPTTTLIEKSITENGTYNAINDNANGYSSVTVNVPSTQINNQDKTVTENGTITADEGYTGLGTVTVNVQSGGSYEDLVSPTATNYQGSSAATGALRAIIKFPPLPPINGTTLTYAFFRCLGLKTIGPETLVNFNTSNVTDFSYMFKFCTSLEYIDLSGFDNSKVTNHSEMFYNCTKLKELNLKNFKKPSSNISNMFYGVPSTCHFITNSQMAELISNYSPSGGGSFTNITIVKADWE